MMTWRMRMMRKEQERHDKEEQSRAWRQGKGLIRRQAPLSPHSQPLQANRASPPMHSLPPSLPRNQDEETQDAARCYIYMLGDNLYSPPFSTRMMITKMCWMLRGGDLGRGGHITHRAKGSKGRVCSTYSNSSALINSKNRFSLIVISQTFSKEETIIEAKFWQRALNTNLYGRPNSALQCRILLNFGPI